MDREEARAVARAALAELREESWGELRDELLARPRSFWLDGASGTRYGVEVEAVWDDREGGNLRVLVAVDDGGWRAWLPVTDDFIVTPDGAFAGE